MSEAPERLGYCGGCNSVGFLHCSDPVHCGSSAEYIRKDVFDAAIAKARADGMREAAEIASVMSSMWWAEYKDRNSPHCASTHIEGKSDGAEDVENAILAAIGGAA